MKIKGMWLFVFSMLSVILLAMAGEKNNPLWASVLMSFPSGFFIGHITTRLWEAEKKIEDFEIYSGRKL